MGPGSLSTLNASSKILLAADAPLLAHGYRAAVRAACAVANAARVPMKRLSHLVWLAFALVTLAWLAWRESAYSEVSHPVVEVSPVTTVAIPEKPLSAATLALAFGFQAPGQRQSSQADIALKASFVSSQGDARALVKSHGGEAIYRVGDRLPGHGVLRSINVRSIVLWINGREEVVSLSSHAPSVFLPTGAVTHPRPDFVPSARLLREVQ